MKLSTILLFHLAISYCTNSDKNDLLYVKEPSEVFKTTSPAGKLYCENIKNFHSLLLELNQLKTASLTTKLSKIAELMKVERRDPKITATEKSAADSSSYINRLYSNLLAKKTIEKSSQPFLSDLQFLSKTINEGLELESLDGKSGAFPYNQVANDFCLLSGKLSSLWKDLKSGKDYESFLSLPGEILGIINDIDAEAKSLNSFLRKATLNAQELLLESQRFQNFVTNLSHLNERFKEKSQNYISLYEKLYANEDKKTVEFEADNLKLFYYILSSLNAIEATHTLLINLKNPGPAENESLSFGHSAADLASKLFIHHTVYDNDAHKRIKEKLLKELQKEKNTAESDEEKRKNILVKDFRATLKEDIMDRLTNATTIEQLNPIRRQLDVLKNQIADVNLSSELNTDIQAALDVYKKKRMEAPQTPLLNRNKPQNNGENPPVTPRKDEVKKPTSDGNKTPSSNLSSSIMITYLVSFSIVLLLVIFGFVWRFKLSKNIKYFNI